MLGYRSRRDMRRGLTVREYQQWAILDEYRLIGERRQDLRLATVAASLGDGKVDKILEAWDPQRPKTLEELKLLIELAVR